MARRDRRVVTYKADANGYRVTVLDAANGQVLEEYSAGNSVRDSQQPARSERDRIPLPVLKGMAHQTAEQMVAEHGIPLDRVSEEEG